MKDLEQRIEDQPKYKIGQAVNVKIKSKSEQGFEFENEMQGWISEIKATGTSEEDTYSYGITRDMPGCYHNGERPFMEIIEKNIVLTQNRQ